MDFTSRQFRAFALAAQHQSFSRAAEALYITPSGLSVLIRELENQLGFRLFDRTTRQVKLTAHGGELLEVVRQTLNKLDDAVSHLGQSATEASRTLSIGAPALVAANVLPQAIKEFRGQQPNLQIRVFDYMGEALTQLVVDGELDMSIGAFFKPATGICRTPLFRFSLAVIRPDEHPSLKRSAVAWSSLKSERLLSLPPGNLIQQFVDKQMTRVGVFARPHAIFNYLDTIMGMVEAGEGIAVIPSYILFACRNRKISMSRLINPAAHLDFSRISLRGKRLPAGTEEFTSFLQAYMARWAGRAGILS